MILDPWTIGSIENLLFLLKLVTIDFYMICWVTQHELASKLQDGLWQSRTVNHSPLLSWNGRRLLGVSSEKNLVVWILDSLNIFIHCRLSYCPPFQEYFLLIWSLDLQTVAYHHTVQNDLLLKFHWTAVYFTWLQQSATTNWNIFSNSKNIFSYFKNIFI